MRLLLLKLGFLASQPQNSSEIKELVAQPADLRGSCTLNRMTEEKVS